MPLTLQDVRQQYPQYKDIDDATLADKLHAKFYSDMPREEFDQKIGFNMTPQEAALRRGERPAYLGPDGTMGDFNRLTDFGVGDEMIGAGQFVKQLVKTGSLDKAEQAYSDAAEYARAAKRIARERQGGLGTAAEIASGFALAPESALVNAARAGTATAATVGPRLGFLGRQAQNLRVAAPVGGAYGFAEGEGGLGNRVTNAAETAALATGFGAAATEALPAAQRALGGAYRFGRESLRRVANPAQAASNDLADRLTALGVTPDQLRQAIVGRVSAQLRNRGIADDAIADMVGSRLSGESAQAVAQRHGVHPSTVDRYFNRYRADNPTPLNIIEIAEEIAGPAASSVLARDARADFILSRDEEGANRLFQRQREQPQRITDELSGTDYVPRMTKAQEDLRQASKKAYDAFYAEPPLATRELDDLMEDPTFRRAVDYARRNVRADAIAENQRGGNRMVQPLKLAKDARNDLFEPQELDYIQRYLRAMSENASDPAEARYARNLRQIFLDRMDRHYPNTWPQIRRDYADAITGIEAAQRGASLANPARAGEGIREAIDEFNRLTPEQQALFRLGFEQKITDMARSVRRNAGAANQFMTPAFQDLVEAVYPANDAARLIRFLNREASTTSTRNAVFGNSNTAQTEFDLNDALNSARAAAGLATGNISAFLKSLSETVSRFHSGRAAAQRLRMLTETNPRELIGIIQRLARSATTQAERMRYIQDLRVLRQSIPAVNRRAIGAVSAARLAAGNGQPTSP